MADIGKGLAYGATGAAIGAPAGPIGSAVLGAGGFLYGAFAGGGDNAAPAPAPSQYGGNPLTNQLAAQQYAAGLQQQQAQNAREAAFYGNANGNFDVANAAQLRQGPQITTSAADRARQIAALQGTQSAIGNVNQTGQQLTALGTRPMGASYAEAQLRQGQDAAMAQQLSMARSGRSLGSGQASMNQAMFNNAALNQQTNQAAAAARIQEQNAYNQFQANALGQAGQQYGASGALAGQAGGQATTIRQGNEGVQAQNANLNLQQQGVNNQTSGIYNQLGMQQQQLGMQANSQGQNAYQFGANQASGMQGAQLNADTGRLSSATATNIANQNNANAHDAATMNMVSSGIGAGVEYAAGMSEGVPPAPSANNPSGSTSPYSNITKASSSAGPTASDERLKTNIKALGGDPGKPGMIHAPTTAAATKPDKYAEFSAGDAAAYRAADEKAARGEGNLGPLMDDENAGKVAVETEQNVWDRPASYAQTIAALNAGYAPSQSAPTDVLNRVPGAGAGHSASQDAVIAQMLRKPGQARQAPLAAAAGGINAHGAAAGYSTRSLPPVSGDTLSSAGHAVLGGGQTAAPSGGPIPTQKVPLTGATRTPAPQAAAPAWGDVFNAPELDPKVTDYLAGGNPYNPVEPANKYAPQYSDEYKAAEYQKLLAKSPWDMMSDERSKTHIRPAPAVDFRPARPYEYEYKDPNMPGAAPGRQVGPMAQDLLRSPTTAQTVHETPQGLQVDTPRLTMAMAGAMSEQQRRTEELERQIAALGGSR